MIKNKAQSSSGRKKSADLQNQIKDLHSQINALTNKWKRALADYQNLEKRVEQEKNDFVKFYNASLIDKLLAVLDDLERAGKHLKNQGLTIIVDQFKKVLETEGVEVIKTNGEKFDPEKMDCLEIVEGQKNIIMETTLKGYLLNGRVIRPAKVKVGKG